MHTLKILMAVIKMTATKDDYKKLSVGNSDCLRPIGGNCVGNCRKTGSNVDCLRPIGGNCVGNCRKTGKNIQLEW